ncbi:MFS transporter [Actinoplanes sp. NPDC049681]|uniref:MFS transporter n=1 Tax=Actinoplanes sp. NPDC049681 TaxID=3363905 RepID=UPI0037A03D8F
MLRSSWSRVAALPGRAKVLLWTNAVSSFGGGLVLPFLWVYLRDIRGLPVWVPAATLAVQAATAVVGGLVWGALLDRMPYRVVVPTVMTIAGVGTAAYALAGTPVVALTAAVVYGIGISGVGTVLRTMYAAVTEGAQRSLVFSLDFAVFNGMTGVGVVAGGLVSVAHLGTAVERFSALYVADGLTFVMTALVTAALLPRGTADADRPAERRPGSYLSVLRDPRLLAILAVMLLTSVVCYGQFRSGLPGYLTASGALGAGGLSFAFALNIVVAVVTQFALMPALQRVRRTTLVGLSGLLFAGCWLLVLVAGTQRGTAAVVLAAAGVTLMSVGEVLVVPVLSALLNDVVGDEVRGRANALFSTMLSSGSVLGPAVAAILLPPSKGLPLMVFLIAGSLLTSGLVWVLRRRITDDLDLERTEEPAPAEPALQS